MIGTIHGLSGAAIASTLPLAIGLPTAFLSHFVLDALPHWGLEQDKRDSSYAWKIATSVDAIATLGLAFYAFSTRHYNMFLGGLFATAPDYFWVARIIKNRSFNLSDHGNWFTLWHAKIQSYERPWGLFLEIPILCTLIYVVLIKLW